MPDNSIYDTLHAALSGTTLTLTPATFPGDIADVLTEYFPSAGMLVIDGVNLAQDGEAVTFSDATGVSAPLAGMTIAARFAPAAGQPGARGVVMTLTAAPPAHWLFSASWPLLANGPSDQLSVAAATLTLSSVAVAGQLAKGLNFAGMLGFPPGWSVLAWLLGGAATVPASGPIGQRGTAPSFSFTAKVGSVDLPVLGTLTVTFTFASATVSGAVQPPDALAFRFAELTAGDAAASGPVISPWVPQVTLGITATIQIAGTGVPILIDLSAPLDTLPVTADTSKLSLVTLAEVASVLGGPDLGGALPPPNVFDPGEYFTLETLSLTLSPARKKILSAGFTMGTHKAWPITSGLSAGPVTFTFLVGFEPAMVAASLTGSINFTGGSFGMGAYYPGFIFTGGLTPGSTIDLAALLSQVLGGTPVNATLALDELDFVVQPLNGGSFSLSTGLTGDWSFPVGAAKLALTHAGLELSRQSGGSSGSGTSGSISARAVLTPPAGTGDPITFDGAWTLPGQFSLSGKFPDLDLTALATKVSGSAPQAGVPDIALTDGVVAVLLDLSTGDYTFALATSASVDKTPIGSAIFAVRRTPTAFGFVIGFVVRQDWSPASIWPELAPIFGGLSFGDSGLLISTLPAGGKVDLPNLTMPSVPAALTPGFTFFSTLALRGAILGSLAELFDEGVTLNLLAVVDTATPANSAFQAIFHGNSANNNIAWTDIVVTLKPAATSFSIKAGARFMIEGDVLALSGEGVITLEPVPSFTFSLLVGNWVHPFGIQNLTIRQFGLQIGYKDGAELTIGLLGAFEIGTAPRTFTLVIGGELIDFEAPGALIFELDSDDPQNPLLLTDVIKQFTQLDLSSVPVLDKIGFLKLDFAVVDDPAGFTIGDYHFPFGIGIAADIFIYSWEAKFNLQVSWGKGIIASGSINKPIELGGIFKLSDVTGEKGPSGSIDTSQIPSRAQRRAIEQLREQGGTAAEVARLAAAAAQPYFTLDGRVQLLGIEESVKASASGKTFDFEISWAFLDVVTAHLACHLIDATNFSAAADIGFNLDVRLGPYSVGGIELVPRIHIDGPSAALAFGIEINPTVIAQLSLGLKFSWAGLNLAVGFTLTAQDIANELTNLWSALITWLEKNVGALFADILADVEKWVAALEGAFAELGRDIGKVADALANFFQTGAADAAAFLKRLGFEFLHIVEALVDYFKLLWDDAYEIVESLYENCSVSNAELLAYNPRDAADRYTLPDVAFSLTASPGGQHLLLTYYRHEDELRELLAPHPYLRSQLASLARSPERASDMRFMADTAVRALVTVAPQASPDLAADIDDLIPRLMRYRDMSVAQVLSDLGSQ